MTPLAHFRSQKESLSFREGCRSERDLERRDLLPKPGLAKSGTSSREVIGRCLGDKDREEM